MFYYFIKAYVYRVDEEGVSSLKKEFNSLSDVECVAEYKKEIIDMVNGIDNVCILKFVFNMIVSIKKKWGV